MQWTLVLVFSSRELRLHPKVWMPSHSQSDSSDSTCRLNAKLLSWLLVCWRHTQLCQFAGGTHSFASLLEAHTALPVTTYWWYMHLLPTCAHSFIFAVPYCKSRGYHIRWSGPNVFLLSSTNTDVILDGPAFRAVKQLVQMNEYDVKEKQNRLMFCCYVSLHLQGDPKTESLMMCVFIQVAVPGLPKTYASRSWWCAASCLCRSGRWRQPMPSLRTQVGLQGCSALVLICHWGLLKLILAQSSYSKNMLISSHTQACTHAHTL